MSRHRSRHRPACCQEASPRRRKSRLGSGGRAWWSSAPAGKDEQACSRTLDIVPSSVQSASRRRTSFGATGGRDPAGVSHRPGRRRRPQAVLQSPLLNLVSGIDQARPINDRLRAGHLRPQVVGQGVARSAAGRSVGRRCASCPHRRQTDDTRSQRGGAPTCQTAPRGHCWNDSPLHTNQCGGPAGIAKVTEGRRTMPRRSGWHRAVVDGRSFSASRALPS